MSKRIIPFNQKTCTNCLGIYYRAMETEIFVFFVNFDESDESGAVKMYRKSPHENELHLVSDNYFASVGLEEAFRDSEVTWMSPRMQKCREGYEKEFILPLVKEYLELSRKGITSMFNPDGERFNELEQEIDEFYVSLPDMDVGAFLEEKYSKLLSE